MFETFNRLSQREKTLLLTFAALLFFGVLYLFWNSKLQALETLQTTKTELQNQINQIKDAQPKFLAKKQQLEAYENLLNENKQDLSSLMENTAKDIGISLDDFKENKRSLSDDFSKKKRKNQKDLMEYTQSVTIKNVSLEQLSKFLEKLESNRFPVRVTQLNVNVSSSDRQVLKEIQLTVATYRNEEVKSEK
jgi:type II secretory pathway component PulM